MLTGFEIFVFTDGTVNNNDGDPLVDDLFYYSQISRRVERACRRRRALSSRSAGTRGAIRTRSSRPRSISRPIRTWRPPASIRSIHFDATGWLEGRVPSITLRSGAVSRRQSGRRGGACRSAAALSSQFGYQEGRQPFAPSELIAANGFDYVYYLQHNPDVAAAHVDPFQHFQTVGWKEGRNPNALFDTNGYLATYADVAAAHVNPLDHYNQFGWHEGRDPSVGFDTTSYLAAYPDVAAAHVNPLAHFLQFGIHEGRSPFADGVGDKALTVGDRLGTRYTPRSDA